MPQRFFPSLTKRYALRQGGACLSIAPLIRYERTFVREVVPCTFSPDFEPACLLANQTSRRQRLLTETIATSTGSTPKFLISPPKCSRIKGTRALPCVTCRA